MHIIPSCPQQSIQYYDYRAWFSSAQYFYCKDVRVRSNADYTGSVVNSTDNPCNMRAVALVIRPTHDAWDETNPAGNTQISVAGVRAGIEYGDIYAGTFAVLPSSVSEYLANTIPNVVKVRRGIRKLLR